MKALSLRQLCKTYKNGVQALKGIDLDVEEGDFFALLGPNGAGKTTAIGIVTSLVNKTGGKVEVFGLRHRHRARGREVLHRRRAAGNQLQPVREDFDDPAEPGRLLRHPAPRRARADGVLADAAAAVREAQRRVAQPVGRHEAPAHDRARADPRAAAADPRRADRWRGHRGAPLDVGVHQADQRAGHHDHPHDALPRGSGDPLPQRGHHRQGPHHRERPHVDRAAQAADGDLRAQPARTAGAAACRCPDIA